MLLLFRVYALTTRASQARSIRLRVGVKHDIHLRCVFESLRLSLLVVFVPVWCKGFLSFQVLRVWGVEGYVLLVVKA